MSDFKSNLKNFALTSISNSQLSTLNSQPLRRHEFYGTDRSSNCMAGDG
ncbi:MAG: hypothetical protein ACRC62_29245 [Microcoleus sp.]